MKRVAILLLALSVTALGCNEDDPDTVAPNPVMDLDGLRNVEDGTVLLTWTAPGDDGTEGTAQSYDIRYSPTLMNQHSWDSYFVLEHPEPPKASGGKEEFVTPALERGSWFFALRATDDAGNVSEISNNTRVTTLDTIPPPPVLDLEVIGRSGTSITLAWTSPKDSGPVPKVSAYDLRANAGPLDEVTWSGALQATKLEPPQPPGSKESVVFGKLTPGTLYSLGVRSVDEFGNESEISNVVQAATSVPSVTQLTFSERTIGALRPAWSPDGSLIAFGADRERQLYLQIYVTDPAGTSMTRLTNQSEGTYDMRWSPDGSMLAFAGNRADDPHTWRELWVMPSTLGGQSPRVIASHEPHPVLGLAWSPDGQQVAYSVFVNNPPNPFTSTIHLVDPDGANQSELLSLEGIVGSLDWSPDGTRLLLTIQREESDLWTYSLDSGATERLTEGPGSSFYGRYSPDGSRIAFGSEMTGNPDIWIMSADGSNPVQVTVSENQEIAPSWSPDGVFLAYDSFDPVRQVNDIFVQFVGVR